MLARRGRSQKQCCSCAEQSLDRRRSGGCLPLLLLNMGRAETIWWRTACRAQPRVPFSLACVWRTHLSGTPRKPRGVSKVAAGPFSGRQQVHAAHVYCFSLPDPRDDHSDRTVLVHSGPGPDDKREAWAVLDGLGLTPEPKACRLQKCHAHYGRIPCLRGFSCSTSLPRVQASSRRPKGA